MCVNIRMDQNSYMEKHDIHASAEVGKLKRPCIFELAQNSAAAAALGSGNGWNFVRQIKKKAIFKHELNGN